MLILVYNEDTNKIERYNRKESLWDVNQFMLLIEKTKDNGVLLMEVMDKP